MNFNYFVIVAAGLLLCGGPRRSSAAPPADHLRPPLPPYQGLRLSGAPQPAPTIYEKRLNSPLPN